MRKIKKLPKEITIAIEAIKETKISKADWMAMHHMNIDEIIAYVKKIYIKTLDPDDLYKEKSYKDYVKEWNKKEKTSRSKRMVEAGKTIEKLREIRKEEGTELPNWKRIWFPTKTKK